jgi:lipopolysaccharide assembly outer membrane protein LptD (OstA)
MTLRYVRYTALLLFCFVVSGAVWAQAAAPKKPRDIQFEADQVDYDEASKRVRMVGKVKFISEGSVLTAPVAEYQTDKQIAEFTGGVKMVGKQSTATGKEMKVWYGESRGLLKGDVRIISQNTGKTPGKSDQPTVVLCQTLDYNWKSQEGVARGEVKMRQGNKRAFADRAEMYQQRNEILLIGNVRVEQGDGDWLTAQRAIYDTKDQTVRAEGRVVAKTRLEPEKEEPAAQEGAPAKKSLPQPLLVEPEYELIPMRDLPVVPLPWLDEKTVPASTQQ